MSAVKICHRQLVLPADCFTTDCLKQQNKKTTYLQTALLKFILPANCFTKDCLKQQNKKTICKLLY